MKQYKNGLEKAVANNEKMARAEFITTLWGYLLARMRALVLQNEGYLRILIRVYLVLGG